MNSTVLGNISIKSDYLIAVKSINKQSITEEESNTLFSIYKEILSVYKNPDDNYINLVMCADNEQLKDNLNEEDKDALDKLSSLFSYSSSNHDIINKDFIYNIIDNTTMNEYLKIALIRTILDILSSKVNDIYQYKEEINKLIEFITNVDDDKFYQANIFIGFVRNKY